mgnify:CR=1 FL=1
MEESLIEKFVFICSPYRPEHWEPEAYAHELAENIKLAKTACWAAARKGYVPMAPHMYFTQFLDDHCEDQREAGRAMGLAWLEDCAEVWVFGDRITSGMAREIACANDIGIPIKIKHTEE